MPRHLPHEHSFVAARPESRKATVEAVKPAAVDWAVLSSPGSQPINPSLQAGLTTNIRQQVIKKFNSLFRQGKLDYHDSLALFNIVLHYAKGDLALALRVGGCFVEEVEYLRTLLITKKSVPKDEVYAVSTKEGGEDAGIGALLYEYNHLLSNHVFEEKPYYTLTRNLLNFVRHDPRRFDAVEHYRATQAKLMPVVSLTKQATATRAIDELTELKSAFSRISVEIEEKQAQLNQIRIRMQQIEQCQSDSPDPGDTTGWITVKSRKDHTAFQATATIWARKTKDGSVSTPKRDSDYVSPSAKHQT